MLILKESAQFKRDRKRMVKRGKDIEKLIFVIDLLLDEIPLPENYKDHVLIGNYRGYRECHIEPDWLLVYRIEEDFLSLYKTGTHSDIFKKWY